MPPPPTDETIRRTIFALLDARSAGASICPSEVARRLVADEAGWRALMPRVRGVAADLAREGRLAVTRRGHPVDACAPGGPIRLARPGPNQASRS